MFLRKKINFVILLLLFFCNFGVATFSEEGEFDNIYRFYSDKYRVHFYTMSESEGRYILNNYSADEWEYEGVAWSSFGVDGNNRSPVYRFHSLVNNAHFYTMSETEKHYLEKYNRKDWKYEGVAWYSFADKLNGAYPVHRFYSPMHRTHFYTTSNSERDSIKRKYSPEEWSYEGIAWYSLSAGKDPGIFIRLNYGPEITIGLRSFERSELRNNSFRLEANKPYLIKDKKGKIIANNILADSQTKVKYDGDKKMRVYDSISDKYIEKEVQFEAADGNNKDLIFTINRPSMTYNQYRGKLKLRYSDATNKIWLIETVPLEQYLWGYGEITGTGSDEYDKAMLTAARTYAYWKLMYSTKYASEGFKVVPTPANQLYKGYVYEKRYVDIKKAAKETSGKVLQHKDGDIALSPYSSWTDGRTRSFEEKWGSKNYPWCQSVNDKYGKHPSKSTSQLTSEGNHMVGISAHGALNLAGNYGWDWQKILKYYLSGISIVRAY